MSERNMRAELGRWIANVSDAELSAELADMQAKADAGIEEPMVDAFSRTCRLARRACAASSAPARTA